jgi:hypothetical protein
MEGPLPVLGAGLAVLLLVLLAYRIGFRGTPQLEGKAEALALAQTLPGGFSADTILLTTDRRHALLADGAGRIALVSPHGAHFIARLFSNGAVIPLPLQQSLDLGFGHGLARIVVGEQLPEWLDLLQQARTRS